MKGFLFASALAAASFAAAPAWASNGAGGSAGSLEAAAASLTPNGYVWQDTGEGGPVRIIISLADQRAYVYRGDALVAVSTVSSGKEGRETPVGSFSILQKQVTHKSSLYDDAPMPFMERLTWDGVALHAGANPGFPASHGCVRLPTGFAKKLYGITRVGTKVTVVDTPLDAAAPSASPSQTPDDGDEVIAAQ